MIIKNRHEIIFLYDVKDANPNGDPFENRPRIDQETGINYVTDVRLKRTIRDYILHYKKADSGWGVLIREERKEDGSLKTKEELIRGESQSTLLKEYVDLRLFGYTLAIRDSNVPRELIGPVQFGLGRSLNRPVVEIIAGTTVSPSDVGKEQGTKTERTVVFYSLICFHGVVNENGAQQTGLSEDDLGLMLEAIWNGTKNLLTESKIGHQPRLLLDIIYKESEFHLGDLHRLISASFLKSENEVRDIEDIELNMQRLVDVINSNNDRIEAINYKADKRLKIVGNYFKDKFPTVTVKELEIKD